MQRSDVEGVVLTLQSGQMIKMKTEAYVAKHQANSMNFNMPSAKEHAEKVSKKLLCILLSLSAFTPQNRTDDTVGLNQETGNQNMLFTSGFYAGSQRTHRTSLFAVPSAQ